MDFSMMLPDYIRSNEKTSFSHFTIRQRFPRIIDNIISGNNLSSIQHDRLIAFRNNFFDETIVEIDGIGLELFNESIRPFIGESIFDAPFFVTEMFFYQKIASILSFYTDSSFDYFASAKIAAFDEASSFLNLLANDLAAGRTTNTIPAKTLHVALWGNLADLSLFTLSKNLNYSLDNPNLDNVLINDIVLIIEKLSAAETVHIFLDNAGYELISDLYLIDHLLFRGKKIVVHVKPIPMFVSDVTVADWNDALSRMAGNENSDVAAWGKRLLDAISVGMLSHTSHPFWGSAYSFSDNWLQKLGIAITDIIISKGDLNYRRFFEDRNWDITTATANASVVKNHDVILVRTLKSEIMTGLNENMIKSLNANEPGWMVNGKFGLIQYM